MLVGCQTHHCLLALGEPVTKIILAEQLARITLRNAILNIWKHSNDTSENNKCLDNLVYPI